MNDSGHTMLKPPGRRLAVLAVALAVAAMAFWWFQATLRHGLRSDDYLLTYYCDRISGEVQWGRIWTEFYAGFFGTPHLYRPLIGVSFGVEQLLGLALPGRHAWNILAIAITAMAVAAATANLCQRRRALAAAIAGMVTVLHPGAIEPAAWLCARSAGMQIMFSALTMWLFSRQLAQQRRSWLAPCMLIGALGCREGAVVLPAALLLLDALFGPPSTVRQRCQRHWPFWLVLAIYLLGRRVIFGQMLPPGDGDETAASMLRNVAVRTAQVLLPPDGQGAPVLWSLPLLLLALLPLAFGSRRAILVLPLWLLLLQAPAAGMAGDYATLFGRLVYEGVAALAIVAGIAAATATGRLLPGSIVLAASIGWLLACATTSQSWLARYEDEDQLARTIERELAASAQHATAERPFACSSMPYLPLFHDRLWGVLGLEPNTPRDLPVIGLPQMLRPDVDAPQNWNDAAPVAAIVAAGGTFGTWHPPSRRFVLHPAPSNLPPEALRADAGAPRVFLLPTPTPGHDLTAIEVNLPRPAATCRLRLLDDLPAERAFGWQRREATSSTLWFPLDNAVAPLILHAFGAPFRGCELEVDGSDPPVGTTMRLHRTIAERPVPARQLGPTVSMQELRDRLRRPPGGLGAARVYLMLPTGARFLDVPEAGRELDLDLEHHLQWTLRIFGPQIMVHWFWHSQPTSTEPPWRTPLEWALLR